MNDHRDPSARIAWEYGDNYFFVEFIDGDNDAFNNMDVHVEWYSNFSLGKITGEKIAIRRCRLTQPPTMARRSRRRVQSDISPDSPLSVRSSICTGHARVATDRNSRLSRGGRKMLCHRGA